MKKKIISMLLAGVMVLSLAACGSKSDSSAVNEEAAETEEALKTWAAKIFASEGKYSVLFP